MTADPAGSRPARPAPSAEWRAEALAEAADRLQHVITVWEGCADDVTVGAEPDWRGWAADASAQRRRGLAGQLREIGDGLLDLRRSLHRTALELAELRRLGDPGRPGDPLSGLAPELLDRLDLTLAAQVTRVIGQLAAQPTGGSASGADPARGADRHTGQS